MTDVHEPDTGRLQIHLGMTKGALIAFTIVVLAGIAGFIRLEQLASDQRATLRHVRAQQRENQAALREVCRQGDTIYGLTKPIVRLLEFDVANGVVAKKALPVYAEALRVFNGYAAILQERPACEQVLNP